LIGNLDLKEILNDLSFILTNRHMLMDALSLSVQPSRPMREQFPQSF
jgi:hypothetical protein